MERPEPAEALRLVDLAVVLERVRQYVMRFTWVEAASHGVRDTDDLVEEAVNRVMSGVRAWPDATYGTLEDDLAVLLCGTIRSMVGNLKGEFGKEERTFAADDDRSIKHLPDVTSGDDEAGRCETEELLGHLTLILEGDSLAIAMLRCWLQDPTSPPRDLAKILGVPVREIYNAKKRIERKEKQLRWILQENQARLQSEHTVRRQ